ncbi:MAG TPA: TonB-dependent receptor [Pyrinomonadaceae bacterium]|nr:TonB-dependent receptor [Pyrinomonadaceae bacterium]
MKKSFKFLSSIFAIVICLSAVAFGQGTTGSIEGTVADANGAVIPNATVRVTSTGVTTGFNQTVTANSNGFFSVPRVPAGTYRVTVSATNFAERAQDVTVVVDRATTISPVLAAAGVVGEVEVTADTAVTIDPTNTSIDTNITKRVIEALPKGTTFGSLLKIAPNVRPETLGGGFQVDGASGSENVFVVDGQEVTNFRDGTLTRNSNLPFELLQEVQIKSTGLNAEYGGATGGVINVVTVGGNNQFRGNFGVSFEPSQLQGNPRTILNRWGTGTGQFEQFQPRKDGGTNWFPVASLSGPIVKDRLWFAAVYAPQIQEVSRTIDYLSSANPNTRTFVQQLTYNTNVRTEQAFLRLDAQPFSKLRVFGSFLWNPVIQEGVVPGLTAGLSALPAPINFGGNLGFLGGTELARRQGGRNNSNTVNTQATYTPTNNLVLNFRYGRTFLNEKLNSYFIPTVTRFFCRANGNPNAVPGSGCGPGFNSVPNNNNVFLDVSTRTTIDADAQVVGINAGGRHNIKFGFQWNRLFNEVDRGHVGLGVVVLDYLVPISSQTGQTPTGSTAANPSGSCLNVANPNTDPCNWGSGWMQRFGTKGEASSVNQALFVQDSWTFARRVTLNLGLRIENEEVPSFGSGTSIQFGWGDKIAPRFGLSIDLTGDGKTKLFGSYGWFYDRFKYELPRGSFGGDFFRNDYFEILPGRGTLFSNYTFQNILGNATDPIGGNCPGPNAPVWPGGWSICQFDFRIATNNAGADIFETGAVDPNLKAARQSEYTFGIERELWRNSVISGRYTHKQVDRTVEDIGVVNPQGSEAYIIGNPGFGLVCTVASAANLPCPKAQRDYDAVEIRFDRRATNWFANMSYTISRLYGNYSGLASSDEAGRNSPNVNRFFDLPPLGFTADGDPDNGRLATDRPHVFKAYGGYTFNWAGKNINATTVSAFTTVQSGTPLTTIYNLYSLGTTILNGRGDAGRTEMFTETDVNVSHRYRFGRDARFSIEPFIDIRNVFNERNVLTKTMTISGTNYNAAVLRANGCTTCGTAAQSGGVQEAAVFNTIFNGTGIRQFVLNHLAAQGTSAAGRVNTYLEPNGFQGPRTVRFGARFFF